MAKLVTIVKTYFGNNFRNNCVEVEIPDEAARLIQEHWVKKSVSRCVKAKYLSSNQDADCFLLDKNETTIAGVQNIVTFCTREDETVELKYDNI